MESDYIELSLTEMDNQFEMEYRERIQPQEEKYNSAAKQIEQDSQFPDEKHLNFLRSKGIEFHGSALDLGAGSTWFSCIVSKLPKVEQVVALDFSKYLLTSVAPEVMSRLEVSAGKVTRVRGSFYDLSYFTDRKVSFNFVTFHCSLHHADDPVAALMEANKVIKPEGYLICLGEPVVPNTAIKGISKALFGRHERKLGITEKCYTLHQWEAMFKKGGFTLEALPFDFDIHERSKTGKFLVALGIPLGSLLFKKYILIAKKIL